MAWYRQENGTAQQRLRVHGVHDSATQEDSNFPTTVKVAYSLDGLYHTV